ncbi:hypothetical protein [Schleiferilactobacillus perolens]|uniref:hypothetical protein n=1 Tax=Schleiferilactobacillus perolens TaxID=100468 RepID=UPI00070BF817|nr:hypothetical protein [Schleiferilactobacillus perolens]
MKKSVVLWSMVALSFIGLASGCQPQNDASSASKQSSSSVAKKKKEAVQPAYQELADKNRTALADKYKQAPQVTYVTNEDVVYWLAPTIKEIMKDSTADDNKSFIQGYVTDWEQVNDAQFSPTTNLKVRVQKVLAGDTQLTDKTITVNYTGGYVPYSTYDAITGKVNKFESITDKKGENISPETTVLAQYNDLPTPSIGTTVVMPIHNYQYKKASAEYQDMVKKAGLDQTYSVISEIYTTWMLNPKTGKLTNNNAVVTDKKENSADVAKANAIKVQAELEKKLAEDKSSDS